MEVYLRSKNNAIRKDYVRKGKELYGNMVL